MKDYLAFNYWFTRRPLVYTGGNFFRTWGEQLFQNFEKSLFSLCTTEWSENKGFVENQLKLLNSCTKKSAYTAKTTLLPNWLLEERKDNLDAKFTEIALVQECLPCYQINLLGEPWYRKRLPCHQINLLGEPSYKKNYLAAKLIYWESPGTGKSTLLPI